VTIEEGHGKIALNFFERRLSSLFPYAPGDNADMTKFIVGAGLVVLLSSTAANIALLRENRHLSTQIESLNNQQMTPRSVALPSLRGSDLSGHSVDIDVKNLGHPSVLFVFSPACSVCKKNWPNWDSILTSQKKLGWQPVFVNVGDRMDSQYVASHNLRSYTTLDDVSKDSVLSYRFLFTPETVILNSQGKAEYVWVGALSPEATTGFNKTISQVR
jgi:AhpC/TSA family